jgi:hypothetical protein
MAVYEAVYYTAITSESPARELVLHRRIRCMIEAE